MYLIYPPRPYQLTLAMREPSNTMPSKGLFVSQTLPDIDPRTHIIGLVGTHDFEDAASPTEDGWFLSDFYLFNNLFRDLGASQTWLTCLDPDFLIGKYAEYAHGNHYHTRKIVLSADHRPVNITVEKPETLLERFVECFQQTCSRAQLHNEPVLLIILGHGDDETKGVHIGLANDGNTPLLAKSLIKDILSRFPGVNVAALMTSCYSGGWTTDLNMTVMAAAGYETESMSWPESPSLGRYTGSIYTSAVLAILAQEDSITLAQEDSAPQDNATSMKDTIHAVENCKMYQQFAADVRAKLLLLDRFGEKHKIAFSAQDNDWTSEYHKRTGIPLAVYKERWERLRTIPSTDKTAFPYGDRTTDEQLQQWGLSDNLATGLWPSTAVSLRGRCGGSTRAVEAMMKKRVQQYLKSYPGRAEAAPNHTIFALMRKCLRGEASFEDLDRLEKMLDYREKLDKLVVSLVVVMGLTPFPQPHEWDPDSCQDDSAPGDSIFQKIVDSRLLPKPLPNQGRFSNKPTKYLVAAFRAHHIEGAEVDRRLMMGQKWVEEQVQEIKAYLEKSYTERKRTWRDTFRHFRHQVRSLSPRKRNRGSLSETPNYSVG